MSTPTVTIMGKDIYPDYVKNLVDIKESKTFDKIKLTVNTYKLPVLNYDNQFSINNPVSMFHGTKWLYTNINIKDGDRVQTWDGSIVSMPRNHGNMSAIIESKDSVFKFRDQIVELESADWETGAEVFQNLCDYVGYADYDLPSIQKSFNILTDNNCKIKVNINLSDKLTFQKALEKIAIYSNAFIFLENNKLKMKVWAKYTGGSSIEITDDDYKNGLPIVDEDEGTMVNDYSISYFDDQGIPAIDSANNKIGSLSRSNNETKSFQTNTSVNNQFVFKDLVSAVYIGEGKIRRSHKNLATAPKPLTFMDFNLYSDFRNRLTLDTYIKASLSRENFTKKVFEPFKYTISETKDNIKMRVYEISS